MMVSPSRLAQRPQWMSTLAQSSLDHLEIRLEGLGELPPHQLLRPPEIGLVTVQGRAGGTGQRFVLGEVPMTRCVIRILDRSGAATTGFGYVQGRHKRQAELAAVCDGLLQWQDWHERVMGAVIEPLAAAIEAHRHQRWQTTAATQVEFFTLERGRS